MIELVIVSRLLEYPDAALWQHQQEMFEAIAASKNLSKEDAHALGIFLRDLTAMDPLDAQAPVSYTHLIHNSVTRITPKPTHMIGGYAHLAYGFNYYGTVGSNRDEFVVVRKMKNIDWLDGEGNDQVQESVK